MISRGLVLRTLALTILVSGCQSAPEEKEKPAGTIETYGSASSESERDPANFKSSAKFSVVWGKTVSNTSSSQDRTSITVNHPGMMRWITSGALSDLSIGALQPALMGDGVYAANAAGGLSRFNAADGGSVWKVDAGMVITAGVGVGEGLVVVGGEKGEVAAYDENGKLRWKTIVSSEVLGVPAVAQGIVVVRSGDGRIAGLGVADGKRKWLFEHAMPALVVRSSAGVTVSGDMIFAGYPGGKLVAIDLTSGGGKWEATLSEPRGNTELERISDITSPPQVDNDSVCAVSYQGRVGCFSRSQGSLLWSKEMSSDKGLLISGNFVYVSNVSGEVYALDKASGNIAWKNGQLDGRHTSAPAVFGNYLVVGEKEGYLYALRLEDGSIAARMRTDGSPLTNPPLPLGKGIMVQTYNGELYFVTLN